MKRLVFDFGTLVKLTPPLWPNGTPEFDPSDLTKLVPNGNGVYGYQDRPGCDPFRAAPSMEESGGIVYFGSTVDPGDFRALLRVLGIKADTKGFGLFVAESAEPDRDGYIVQMRLATDFALKYLFRLKEPEMAKVLVIREESIGGALDAFMDAERQRWGTTWMKDQGLHGMFGGDGDFACEELAFGLMVENEYYGVYRIWSRAWLVTK